MAQADKLSPLHVYPLRLEDVNLFDTVLKEQPNSAYGHYYYGNLLYYIGQKEQALAEWLKSTELKPDFSISLRNVGFAYGQQANWDLAMKYYDLAIQANPDDALLFTESDKIYESANAALDVRLKRLESHLKTVMKHDDAVMRLLSLYNVTGKYDKAIDIMKERHFHLWEGGGQIHDIYVDSHMLKGLALLDKKQYKEAIQEFDLANQYPANLEVAPSYRGGSEVKAYYLTGIAYEGLNQPEQAKAFFQKAADAKYPRGLSDLAYYRVKALQKLGKTAEANAALQDMETFLERTRTALDSYAKFGEANQNVRESNIAFYAGLIHLLQQDEKAAQADFAKALELYPGNIWAEKTR